MGLIIFLFLIITFEPETLESHPKYQKTDFSLVSNKSLSKILPSSSLGPGPDEVGKRGLKVFHLWRHLQKNHNPQKFFIADAMTCRVFKGWNSSLAQSATGTFPHKDTCKLLYFSLNILGKLT